MCGFKTAESCLATTFFLKLLKPKAAWIKACSYRERMDLNNCMLCKLGHSQNNRELFIIETRHGPIDSSAFFSTDVGKISIGLKGFHTAL